MSGPDQAPRWWPTSPFDFADVGKCPACFTPISRRVCPVCLLDLADPRNAELADLGAAIVDAETRRQDVLRQVRAQPMTDAERADAGYAPTAPAPTGFAATHAATPHAEVPAGAALFEPPEPRPDAPAFGAPQVEQPAAQEIPTAQEVPAAQGPVSTGAAPAGPAPAEPASDPAEPRRRLTVPVLLLIVGVSLVSVAAIFFLVLAWYISDIGVRALIIGGVTLVTMLIATLLRRRRLTMTAEGIAVLGTVLIGLDVWAIRANDLFGTEVIRPALYAGGGLLIVALLCRVWALLAKLRAPDFAAVVALPAGLGLLVAGLWGTDDLTAATAGLFGAAIGGLAHALPRPIASALPRADAVRERTILAAIGVGALVAGTVTSWFAGPEVLWAPLAAAAATTVIALTHALLLRGGELPWSRVLAAVATTTAAVALTSLGWHLAARSDAAVFSLFVTPVLAVAVPVALARLPRQVRGVALTPAVIGAAVVGGMSLFITLAGWLWRGGEYAIRWTAWTVPPFSGEAHGLWTLGAGLVVGALLLALPRPRRLAALTSAVPAAAGVVALIGAFASGVPGATVIVGAALAVACIVALRRSRTASVRAGWVAAGVLGAASAYAVGHAHPLLWIAATIVAIALPIGCLWARRPAATSALAPVPFAVVAVVSFSAPAAIAAQTGHPSGGLLTTALVLQWAAVITLGVAAASATVRRSLSVAGIALVVGGLGPVLLALMASPISPVLNGVHTLIDRPLVGVIRAAITAGLLILLATRAGSGQGVRIAGAALVPFALVPVALVVPAVIGEISAYSSTALLDGFGWTRFRESGAVITLAATAVVVVAAGALLARRTDDLRTTRWASDAGAVALLGITALWATPRQHWMLLALVALAFAAASIAPGWRAGSGRRLWRPLLVWPAAVAASLAWWEGLRTLGTGVTPELRLIPVAALFAALCLGFVWLRRMPEGAGAVTISFSTGLIALAVVGWERAPLHGTVVVIVAAALTLALTWTPARRLRAVSAAGAITAILAVLTVAVERGSWVTPAEPEWLLAPVALAYLAGFGSALRPLSPGVFALIVPPVTLVASCAFALNSTHRPVVYGIGIAALGLVHVLSALLARAPFGAVSRWISLGAAFMFAASALVRSQIEPIEWVTLPVAAILLAGAGVAIFRASRVGRADSTVRAVSPVERAAWVIGAALAIVPSVFAPLDDMRTWLVIAVATAQSIGVGMLRHPLALPTAYALSGGALVMAARSLAFAFDGALPAAVAGLGAITLGAVLVLRRRDLGDTLLVAPVAGSAVSIVAAVAASGGVLDRTIVVAVIAGALGVGAAWLLARPRWVRFGAVVAAAGILGVLLTVARRLLAVVELPGLEAVLWPFVAIAVVWIISAVALLRTQDRGIALGVGGVLGLGGLLLGIGEAWVLFDRPDAVVAVASFATIVVLTIACAIGFVFRERIGAALFGLCLLSGALFVLVAAALMEVRPIELLTAPPALGILAVGGHALARNPQLRTWPALGPGLTLLTLPSLLHDFGATELWRVVTLGVVALALVVIGAAGRLQAPIVIGAVVLLVHAVTQLWPWIAVVYTGAPWWLWAGIAGVLLIYVALRYERQKLALRRAFVAVTALR